MVNSLVIRVSCIGVKPHLIVEHMIFSFINNRATRFIYFYDYRILIDLYVGNIIIVKLSYEITFYRSLSKSQ